MKVHGHSASENRTEVVSEWRYKFLPSGNAPEFPKIETYLVDRGVRLEKIATLAGGAFYRWPRDDTEKMPNDGKGYYFGDENGGYQPYERVTDGYMEDWIKQDTANPDNWRKCSGTDKRIRNKDTKAP